MSITKRPRRKRARARTSRRRATTAAAAPRRTGSRRASAAAPRRAGAAPLRAGAPPAAAPPIRLVAVPADPMVGGLRDFTIREDLAPAYRAVMARVHALGGEIFSSGGIRDLREPATAGRSRTSLHYTGRAIDLCIDAGMHGPNDRYAIVPVTGGATPRWTLYCVSRNPVTSDPLYDASLIRSKTLQCAVWRKGKGYVLVERTEQWISLTDLFAAEGWVPIPARSDWQTQYLSCEWWHFQHHKDLVVGVSRFGDELRAVWAAALVAASGLALDAVWAGLSFKTGVTPTSPPAPDQALEKERWVQTVLDAVDGAGLTIDGALGPRSRTALRAFQRECALPATGTVDGATETALLQRALERLGHTPFPAVGRRDAVTTDAVRDFQRSASLGADGVVGPATRAAMVARLHQSAPARAGEPSVVRTARRRAPAKHGR